MKDFRLLIKAFLLFLFLAGTYCYFDLKSGTDLVKSLFVSSFFGIFMLLGISGIMTAFFERAVLRLVNAAKQGKKPENNKLCAIMGTIEPVKEYLSAPLSAKPCVAYEYNIYHVSQTDGSSKVYDFEGWAVTPCSVKTSFGKIKLLGILDLKDYARQQILNYGNANKYIQSTSFNKSSFKKVKSIKKYLDLFSNTTTETIGEDIRHSDETEASGLILEERCVLSGSHVCAIGKYSTKHNGLIPNATHGIRLLPSNKHDLSKDVKRSMRTQLVISLLFLGFAFMMLILNN